MGNDDLDRDPKSGSLKETQVLFKPATLDTGCLLVGRFKILSLQGCGRFGCVYKAKDLQLNILVAIKVLHQHLLSTVSLRNFKNEILTLRQLSHPNIVRVHEYYEDNDTHFITMDWIEGKNLSDWLEEHKKASPKTVESFIEQLLSALEVTQSKGIRHKDLKPENILVDHNEQLYIADFGIAVAMGNDPSAVISGTPLYSPPEYLDSGRETVSIDIYAFGLIIHELITGKLPYQAQTQYELIVEKQKPAKTTLGKTYSVYEKLIQKCTAPIAGARPQNVSEVWKLIHTAPSDTQSGFNSKIIIASIALLLVLCAAVVVYTLNGTGRQSVVVEEKGVRSLTILPFETKFKEMWLTEGLPHLLSGELLQVPDLRIVDYERARETLDLLGYQTPLDESQLKVISDLTQSPYLLKTQLMPIGPDQYQVTIELMRIAGNNVNKSTIVEFKSNKEQLTQKFIGLASVVNDEFGLEAIDESEHMPASIDLDILSQVELLLQKGEHNRAKEQLKLLLMDTPDYSKGWLQLGQIETEQGNILEAESAFNKALESSKESSLIHKKTQAELQLSTGDIDAAIKTYQDILSQLPNNSRIRFDLAQLLIEKQLLEEAEQELSIIVDTDANHPSAWYELSKVAIWQGNTQEAVDNYLVKALVTAKKLKNQQLEGDVLNAFGVAYHRLGQLDMSLDYYQQGLASREQINDTRGIVTSLSNLASVYAVKGEYQQAEESLLRALKVNESRNDAVKQADLFNELGVIAEEQGLYDKALEHFQASLSIRMKLDDDWLKAESLNNVAYIFFLLSDEEQASIYWEQAKAYYQKVEDPVGTIRVNENMAQLELQKGNWQTAYRMYQSALKKSEELNLTEETIVSKAYLTKIAFLQGNFEQPLLELADIKKELKERQDVRGQVEFGLWLADWSITSGAYQKAQELLVGLKPLMEQENNRSQQLIYETLSSRLNLYRDEKVDFSINNVPQQVTAKAALEALTYKLELLVLSPEGNGTLSVENLNKVNQQFDQYDLDLHQYYLIRKLILLGYFHVQSGDTHALKTVLDQLVLLKRGSGTYWRNYQIERLQSIYYDMTNSSAKADEHAQEAAKIFIKLKQQLPEEQQQHFISLQGRYLLSDQFTGLINDKQ